MDSCLVWVVGRRFAKALALCEVTSKSLEHHNQVPLLCSFERPLALYLLVSMPRMRNFCGFYVPNQRNEESKHEPKSRQS